MTPSRRSQAGGVRWRSARPIPKTAYAASQAASSGATPGISVAPGPVACVPSSTAPAPSAAAAQRAAQRGRGHAAGGAEQGEQGTAPVPAEREQRRDGQVEEHLEGERPV